MEDRTKGKMSPQETVDVLKYKYNPKPEFEERINKLLDNEKDRKAFWEIVHKEPINSIRCNTLKISVEELKRRLEKLGWKISQPLKEKGYEEAIVIENNLLPGELGKAREHILGYYYVQEISSMLPILALKPTEKDNFLDLCASPGSKTTQAASFMKNSGSILANDNNIGRIIILASNLEKCGVSNTIITRRDGVQLCRNLNKAGMRFDKILVDAPCSGEGTLRSSPKTFVIWNLKTIEFFSRQQKVLASSALELLRVGGEMVYSTCTHSPEENEEVVQSLLDKFDIQIEEVELPIKTRKGLTSWKDKNFDKEMQLCHRIYPQDNNTEGFFLCKIKKLSDKIKGEENENYNDD